MMKPSTVGKKLFCGVVVRCGQFDLTLQSNVTGVAQRSSASNLSGTEACNFFLTCVQKGKQAKHSLRNHLK